MFGVRCLPILSFVLLTGCATCPNGGEPAVSDTLYCGANIPGGGEVTPSEWRRFVAGVVTPRFPKGITTWTAEGQWQNQKGKIEQERSYVLLLVHPPSPAADQAVQEIAQSYKNRFRQEAVLRLRGETCLSF